MALNLEKVFSLADQFESLKAGSQPPKISESWCQVINHFMALNLEPPKISESWYQVINQSGYWGAESIDHTSGQWCWKLWSLWWPRVAGIHWLVTTLSKICHLLLCESLWIFRLNNLWSIYKITTRGDLYCPLWVPCLGLCKCAWSCRSYWSAWWTQPRNGRNL